MARTRIYLTDRPIKSAKWNRPDIILRQAAWVWKDRTDLPDFRAIRSEWDRHGLCSKTSLVLKKIDASAH